MVKYNTACTMAHGGQQLEETQRVETNSSLGQRSERRIIEYTFPLVNGEKER